MEKLSLAQEYAMDIYDILLSMFDEQNENHKRNLNNIDPTAFFQGLALANNMLYQELTNTEGDLLDFLSINQRLVFQFLQDNGREKE